MPFLGGHSSTHNTLLPPFPSPFKQVISPFTFFFREETGGNGMSQRALLASVFSRDLKTVGTVTRDLGQRQRAGKSFPPDVENTFP